MKKILVNAQVIAKNQDLKDTIEACGIEYPHESLAFFKTVYAKFEEPNGNGVILADSVKEQVPQLRGTQMNANHWRKNWIMGTILDSWVNDNDQIEIVFSFYKSVYPDLYEEALQLLDEGKLTVSFELRVADEDVEKTANGKRRLHKVEFDGVGLLFNNNPAYKEAIVYETANIESLVSQDLVFASNIQKQKSNLNKEEETVDKKANEALLAKQKENIIAEFGEEAVQGWTDEDFLNEAKINELRESLKVANEEETQATEEEATEEEGSEEAQEEEAQTTDEEATVYETKTEQVVKEDIQEDKEIITVETKQEVKVDDEVVRETESTEKTTYSYAEVEEIKADYEAKLKEKDEQIESLKLNAETIANLKAELGEFVKDFSDEDFLNEMKVENARLKKQVKELTETQTTLATASAEEAEATEEEATEEEATVEDEAQTEEEATEEEGSEEEATEEEATEEKEELPVGNSEEESGEEEVNMSKEELLKLAIDKRSGKV